MKSRTLSLSSVPHAIDKKHRRRRRQCAGPSCCPLGAWTWHRALLCVLNLKLHLTPQKRDETSIVHRKAGTAGCSWALSWVPGHVYQLRLGSDRDLAVEVRGPLILHVEDTSKLTSSFCFISEINILMETTK